MIEAARGATAWPFWGHESGVALLVGLERGSGVASDEEKNIYKKK